MTYVLLLNRTCPDAVTLASKLKAAVLGRRAFTCLLVHTKLFPNTAHLQRTHVCITHFRLNRVDVPRVDVPCSERHHHVGDVSAKELGEHLIPWQAGEPLTNFFPPKVCDAISARSCQLSYDISCRINLQQTPFTQTSHPRVSPRNLGWMHMRSLIKASVLAIYRSRSNPSFFPIQLSS